MRALVQRVSEASVSVENRVVGRIDHGLLVFLGVKTGDTERDAEALARKVVQLRVFRDEQGKMNRSVAEVGGQLLIVSQFTLYGDSSKGNRPSYMAAAAPDLAKSLYEGFIEACKSRAIPVATGVFQANMQVQLVNDGPVTLLCESESKT